MGAAAEIVRLHLLRQRAQRAMAHASRLGAYLQRKIDEGSDPAWFMVREFDRRYDAAIAALAEAAAAEAEMHSDVEENRG